MIKIEVLGKDEEEKESKSSFSNWFYFVINVGAMIASPVLVWIQMNVAMLVGIWPWLPSCSSREATSTGFRNQEEVPSQECFKSLFASFQKIQIPEAPDAMRSLCSALSLTTVALGNYLSTLLATVVTKVTTTGGRPGWIADNLTRGHLDYYYYCFLNFFAYLWIAKWCTYKKATGHTYENFTTSAILIERSYDSFSIVLFHSLELVISHCNLNNTQLEQYSTCKLSSNLQDLTD
ncbi:LOW QUALITY PROTEIN: hypothetical protein YC2023_087903 [Brassica napus]